MTGKEEGQGPNLRVGVARSQGRLTKRASRDHLRKSMEWTSYMLVKFEELVLKFYHF